MASASRDIVINQLETPRLNLDQIKIINILNSSGRHHLTFEAEYQSQRAFFRKPKEPQFIAGSINETQAAFHLFPKLPEINRQLEQVNLPVRFLTAEPFAMVYHEGQFEGTLHSWVDLTDYSSVNFDSLTDYRQLEGFELILRRWEEVLKMTDYQAARKQIKTWLLEDERYLKEHKDEFGVEQSAHQSSMYVLKSLLTRRSLSGIHALNDVIDEMQQGFDEVSIMKAIVFTLPLFKQNRIGLDTFGTDNIMAKKHTDGTISIFLSDYTLLPFGGRTAQTGKPPVK